MIAAVILVGGGFLKVFLAGVQTKNIQHDRIKWAFFTSLGLNVTDLMLVKTVVDAGLVLLLLCALSQALGIVVAIHLLRKPTSA